jgi:hypothetical protein
MAQSSQAGRNALLCGHIAEDETGSSGLSFGDHFQILGGFLRAATNAFCFAFMFV